MTRPWVCSWGHMQTCPEKHMMLNTGTLRTDKSTS